MSGFVIAVDGPAASGKGTIATMLGRHFGLPVLDTGLLYRAVGVSLMRQGGDLDDETAAARVARGLDPRRLELYSSPFESPSIRSMSLFGSAPSA